MGWLGTTTRGRCSATCSTSSRAHGTSPTRGSGRFAGPVDRWRTIRAEIHEEVCREGFNVELNSFTQSYGSDALDASTLFIPLVGFLPPNDPRVVGTIEAIQRDLTRDGFVERYRVEDQHVDGLPA